MRQPEILQHLDRIGKGAYSEFTTLQNSYDMALHCIDNNIQGCFVECGVGAGAQIAAMALACKVRFGDGHPERSRRIYAIDSYEGIPLAGPKDTSQPGVANWTPPKKNVDLESLLTTSGITAHSLENVQNNLGNWAVRHSAEFVFVKGWFQHTLPEAHKEMPGIAILRLDGDLYESTKVCLEYLFPKLVKGGILIIDDWALTGCRRACDEYFGKYKQLGPLNPIDGATPVWFVKK